MVTDDDHLREEASFGFPSDVEVMFSEDASDARGLFEERIPSLVIVALRTGNSGGFALARDMSQRKDLRDVPVVIVLEREQDEWLARQAAPALCLTKPLDPGRLVAAALDLLSEPAS